ncbi:MAG TPA: SDR family oxidoreductase [Aridibacter sp.]|nr:SDR family oxidoreductase [Aridibacter sp.]
MKATLITGGSSGIGEAFARRLAAEGHNIVLVARSEDELSALCDELMLEHDISAHYVAIDLNDYQADLRLFKETVNHDLEIDFLINNAGFGSMGYFADLDLERELNMISLNVMVLVALTHRYLRLMVEEGEGTIINVSSAASFQPLPFMATYAASKAFVTSFTQAIAEEYGQKGIRIMNLCPGATDTGFFDASRMEEPVMIKGVQEPDEVVETALNALEKGKTSVVSGWMNYFVSRAARISPDKIVASSVARMLRPKVESQARSAPEESNASDEEE